LPDRPDEPDVPPAEPDVSPDAPARPRYTRVTRFAMRLLRPPSSGRGFVLALLVVGGAGSAAALGGGAFQRWSETAGFCSRCHTMAPEARANKLSVHHDVACGECHVGPGVGGLVKSKIKGAAQLLEMVTGTYPKPIPPPDHDVLPSPKDTCMKCHSLSDISKEGSPMKLVLHARYREDEANTSQTVAVVVRPYRLGEGKASRGAHWHVEDRVEYASPDKNSQKIDWVRVTYKDGRTEQFIARSQVGVSSDVRPDIGRLGRTERTRQMDCISCHNRVGHEFPTPEQALDGAISEGAISQSLPFIKRDGVARLSKHYRSTGEADKAIEALRGVYEAKYPLVWKAQRQDVKRAVDKLKLIYRLVADPEMNMVAAEYPNNLGHQSGPGCFRCHDGAHFKVEPGGRLSRKTIPWECTTCHTFPQSGSTVSSVSLLAPPADHKSKLWVFEHAVQPAALEPAAAKSSFCTNCHSSGAANVSHGEMLYHHPQAIERAGLQACAYCHQEVFCARCHKKQVLNLNQSQALGEARRE
jgi:nitrate/TMAO reductase-like tetraheme cytochrome c subunit